MMAAETSPNKIDLQSFLNSAGQSLAQAQGELSPELAGITDMVLSTADLEVKAALTTSRSGKMTIQMFSSQDILKGAIDSGVLSTLKFSFVATTSQASRETASVDKPQRQVEDVVEDVRKRPDIAVLEKIIGPLDIRATYVDREKRWLASASDSQNRIVRELILPDEPKEGNVV